MTASYNLSQLGSNYLQGGSGSVARTTASKLQESVSVKDFGAVGDGTTDDTAAFSALLTAISGKSGFIPNPSVGYKITSALTIPANTRLYGEDKFSTRIFMSGSFNLFTMMNGSVLENLYLDGNSQTGIAVNITGIEGQQRIDNCKIINFNGACVNFAATTAGSYFSSASCLMYQLNGASPSTNYAVVIADGVQASAVPRRFVNFEAGGYSSFTFGGANDLMITNSWLSDLAYSNNSHAVLISSSRIAGNIVAGISMLGGQHSIVGCDVYPVITLGATTAGCVLGPCSWNAGSPVDSSGVSTNLVYHFDTSYTPTWQSTGVAPALGNGTIAAVYSRQGNLVTVYCVITAGSTTTFGTGIYRITLPSNAPAVNIQPQLAGNIRATHGGLFYFGTVLVVASVNYAEWQRDTVNGFSFNTPQTWVSTDVFYLQFSYRV